MTSTMVFVHLPITVFGLLYLSATSFISSVPNHTKKKERIRHRRTGKTERSARQILGQNRGKTALPGNLPRPWEGDHAFSHTAFSASPPSWLREFGKAWTLPLSATTTSPAKTINNLRYVFAGCACSSMAWEQYRLSSPFTMVKRIRRGCDILRRRDLTVSVRLR